MLVRENMRVCMCVREWVIVHVRVWVYLCVSDCMHVCVCLWMCVFRVCLYTRIPAHAFVYVYLRLWICVCVCLCVWIHHLLRPIPNSYRTYNYLMFTKIGIVPKYNWLLFLRLLENWHNLWSTMEVSAQVRSLWENDLPKCSLTHCLICQLNWYPCG